MIRILLFVLLVVAAGLVLALLADEPGIVMVQWLGYRIETTVVFTLAGVALVVGLMLILALLRYVWTRPRAVVSPDRELGPARLGQ
jgi:HemY protein